MKKIDIEKLSIDKLYKRLNTSYEGLSDNEADLRLNNDGPNIISVKKKSNIIEILSRVFKHIEIIMELIIVILLSIYYIFTSYQSNLLIFSLTILIINIIANYKYEKLLDKNLINKYKMDNFLVKVKRGNRTIKVSSETLVVGDIIFLNEGDIIPCDAKIIKCNLLKVNEENIDKKTMSKKEDDIIYAGTLVLEGIVEALVINTGKNTYYAKNNQISNIKENNKNNFVKELNKISKVQNSISIILIILFIVYGLFTKIKYIDLLYILILILIANNEESLFINSFLLVKKQINKLKKNDISVENILISDKVSNIINIVFNAKNLLIKNELEIAKIYTDETNLREKELFLEDNKELLISMLVNNNNLLQNKAIEEYLTLYNKTKSNALNEVQVIKQEEKDFNITYAIKDNTTYCYIKSEFELISDNIKYILLAGQVVRLTKDRKNTLLKVYEEMKNTGLHIETYLFKKSNGEEELSEKTNNLVFLGFVGYISKPAKNVKKYIKELNNNYNLIILSEENYKNTQKLIGSYDIYNKEEIIDCKNKYDISKYKCFTSVKETDIEKIKEYYDNKNTIFINIENENAINISETSKDVKIPAINIKNIELTLNKLSKLNDVLIRNKNINICLNIIKNIIIFAMFLLKINLVNWLMLVIAIKYLTLLPSIIELSVEIQNNKEGYHGTK